MSASTDYINWQERRTYGAQFCTVRLAQPFTGLG